MAGRKRSIHDHDATQGKEVEEQGEESDGDDEKMKKLIPLDEVDVSILKSYGQQGFCSRQIAQREEEIEKHKEIVNRLLGVRESDTGLLPPTNWDLEGDKLMMAQEAPLEVATCTKIIEAPASMSQSGQDSNNNNGQLEGEDPRSPSKPWDRVSPSAQDTQRKYVIKISQVARYVVGLGEKVAPTDVEEGMRVGVDRSKFSIQVPLPSKIDSAVSMMQVEEKPDVSYQDVGGCDDAVKELREVVELPLLSPDRFLKLGIEPPKGALLYGPPGE